MGEAAELVREVDKETRDRLRARPQPSNRDIICPAVFEATGAAVNYDLTPLTSTAYVDQNGEAQEGFVWKSAPGESRGHAAATYALIEKLKESGEIKWSWKERPCYYFPHEEGVTAAETYMRHVISGLPFKRADGIEITLVANKKSWNNRFADLSNVSYDQLVERHPEAYGQKATPAAATPQLVPQVRKTEVVEETLLPHEDDLLDVGLDAPEFDPDPMDLEEIENEPVEVTAVSAVLDADEIEDIIAEEQPDDHSATRLRLSDFEEPARLSEDCFVRSINGEDVTFYEVELPDCDFPMFLPVGTLDFTKLEKYELIDDED